MFMFDGGYNGYSMSNRAVEAYANGEMPKSKWTKSKILEAIYEQMDSEEYMKYDWEKVSVSTLRSNFLVNSSWHHTSKYYNKTDFYEINTDFIDELNEEKFNQMLDAHKKNLEQQKLEKNRKWITFEKARISFSQWEGSRNYPKKVEYEDYAIIKVEHKFKGYPFDIKRYEYEDMTPEIVNDRGIAYTSSHGKKVAYNYHVIETYPNRVSSGTKSEFDYIQKNVLPNKYQDIKKFNDIGKEKEKLLEQYIKEYQPIYEKEQLELQEKRNKAKKEWIKAETNFLKEEYSSNGVTKVFKLHGLHGHRVASSFNPSSSAIVNSITQDYLSDVYGFEKNQEIDYWQPLPKPYYYEEWCSDVTETNDFILIKITAPTENEVDAYFDFNIKIGYEYGYNTDYENVEQLTIEEALPLIKNDEYKNMVINAREKSLDREDLERK